MIAITFVILSTYSSSKGFLVFHICCFDNSFTALTETKLLLPMGMKESQIRPRAHLGDEIRDDQQCFPNLLFFAVLLSSTSV